MLVTKLWTPLYNSSIWKAPVFPAEVTDLHHSENMACAADELIESPDLAVVFHTLQHTTILLNQHYYNKTPVDGIFIRQCLGFVHSSLLELEGRLENNPLFECLRLGMMVFLATTFRLPDLYEQHYYCKDLTNKLQRSYVAARASTVDLAEAIEIWLVWVLLISTNDVDELFVRASLGMATPRGLTWNETRGHLKQVMWIDSFHDDLGRRAFEALSNRIGPLDV